LALDTKDRGDKILDIIKNSTRHLLQIIEDALDLSRFQNDHFELSLCEFDLKNALEEVIGIMRF
jgi:signal transduction histidine kinase